MKLRVPEGAVKLSQARELTERLQRTLAAVAVNLTNSPHPAIDFELVRAEVASFSLGLRAVGDEAAPLPPEAVFETFAQDLEKIQRQSYRTELTTELTKQYRSLVASLASAGATVEYLYMDHRIFVDEDFRGSFEVALKERVSEGVSLTGYLDAVNAHRMPFAFFLYPKLEQVGRIECRFAPDMLPGIASLLKKMVRVGGTGYFAPVGIYPLRIDVERAPQGLAWDPEMLRSFVGKLNLVPKEVGVGEYLQRNRKVAGIAE